MNPALPEWLLDVTLRTPAPPALAAVPLDKKIGLLRQHRLRGYCVVFHPYERSFGDELRGLRNLPHNKANLAQGADLTAEQQRAWEDGYFGRTDDLCWILLTVAGAFAGSISLYDIGLDSTETGRLVVREEVARSTPIIAECELMIQWLAFAWLGLPHVGARIQPGNVKMMAMHERLGYRITGPSTIRGVAYRQLKVSAAEFRLEPHLKVLLHLRRRLPGLNPGSTRTD